MTEGTSVIQEVSSFIHSVSTLLALVHTVVVSH